MILIHDSKYFTVHSQGNGAYFLITRKSDGADLFLQGEDASIFGDSLDQTNEVYTDDDVCAEYSDVMEPTQ